MSRPGLPGHNDRPNNLPRPGSENDHHTSPGGSAGRPGGSDGGRPGDNKEPGTSTESGHQHGSNGQNRPSGSEAGRPNSRPAESGKPEGGKPEGGKPEGGKPEGGKPGGGRPGGGRPEGGRPQGSNDKPDAPADNDNRDNKQPGSVEAAPTPPNSNTGDASASEGTIDKKPDASRSSDSSESAAAPAASTTETPAAGESSTNAPAEGVKPSDGQTPEAQKPGSVGSIPGSSGAEDNSNLGEWLSTDV